MPSLKAVPLLADWGSVPDWLAAIGTLLAFAATVVLLSREGRARKHLQAAEERRLEEQHREQAARVYIAWDWGTTSSDGEEAQQVYTVRLVNGSAEVIDDVILVLHADPKATKGAMVAPLRRLLPEERTERRYEFKADVSDGFGPDKLQLMTGLEAAFRNSQGWWRINNEHRLTSITEEEYAVVRSTYPLRSR